MIYVSVGLHRVLYVVLTFECFLFTVVCHAEDSNASLVPLNPLCKYDEPFEK